MSNSLSVEYVIEKLGLIVLTDPCSDQNVSSGYCCDMLSWVMSRLERNACWFTILSSMNVVAVASLTECPLVIITEGVHVDEEVLKRAREQEVCICSTDKDTYESVCALYTLLNQPPENN